jgi:hypothetical protein
MTPLSPAAQAVDIAIYGPGLGATRRQIAAAALRAAAVQVVPEPRAFISPGTASQIRSQFLAIAADLGGINNTSQED